MSSDSSVTYKSASTMSVNDRLMIHFGQIREMFEILKSGGPDQSKKMSELTDRINGVNITLGYTKK